MGLWTLYFFAQSYLHYRGYIRLDLLANLLLALFIIVPVPKTFKHARLLNAARHSTGAALAVMLLWHESWLPEPLYAIRTLMHNGMPSREYVYQFLLRLYSVKDFAVLLGLAILAFLARGYRVATLAAAASVLLLSLLLSPGETNRSSAQGAGAELDKFYNSEMTRLVHFSRPAAGNADFDILILHICSLAWDDLRELNLEGHPFFKQFDILFTRFNSVSTYSNPAAIRLLNANCGQRKHGELYGNLPGACSIMESLRGLGYDVAFARNHNGTYGKFDEEVKKFGHLNETPFAPSGLTAEKFMFDDSPVYADYGILSAWSTTQRNTDTKKAALYYNSVSLHDGSHWISDKEWWKGDTREQYRSFLLSLLDELTRFFSLVAASDRNTVIIVLGEHGRAVRGNAIETPGLRDVPLPRITIVPAGIKLLGKGKGSAQPEKTIVTDKQVSYFGLSHAIASLIEHSPFSSDWFKTRAFIDAIPLTDFVSENEGNVIVRKDNDYFFSGKDGKWTRLREEELK